MLLGNQRRACVYKMSSESFKRTLSNVSETIFPGLLLYTNFNSSSSESEIISYLPLQMSLYFNVVFFPVWITTTVLMTSDKFECLSNLYRFISITVLVAVSVIEVLRIYLGYLGNLTEKIPETAGFWMLSILIQLPLQTFLVASRQLHLSPLEYTVQSVMLVLLVCQLLTGYVALRNTAQHQASKFHLMQFTDNIGSVNVAFQNEHEE